MQCKLLPGGSARLVQQYRHFSLTLCFTQAMAAEGMEQPSQQLDAETAWAVGFMPGLSEEEEGHLPPGFEERLYAEVLPMLRELPCIVLPLYCSMHAQLTAQLMPAPS